MADLVTTAELAAYLQRTLDATSAALATASASGLVRAYCGQQFSTQTYSNVSLPVLSGPRGYRVRFPQRPVTAVSAISIYGTSLVSGTDYAWDGASPWLDIASLPVTTSSFPAAPRATVTYTAGYAAVPADVKAVTLAVAGRLYDNPRGLRSRTIGDYSETVAGADDSLAGVTLLAPERRVLSRYRVGAGTVAT